MLKLLIFLISLMLWIKGAFAYEIPNYPSQEKISWSYYKIKKADSFFKLFKTNWIYVARFNRMDENHLIAGQKIKVPDNLETAKTYEPMPFFIEERKHFAKYILIDLGEQWLGAYENGSLLFSAPISSGRKKCLPARSADKDEKTKKIKSCETPEGNFIISAIHQDHYSSLYKDAEENNIPMPYAAMFLIDEKGVAYWLHGGDLPGYPASHGCVRLIKKDAEKLCGWINPKCLKQKSILWFLKNQKVSVEIKSSSQKIYFQIEQGGISLIPLKNSEYENLKGYLETEKKNYNLIFLKRDGVAYILVPTDLYLNPGIYNIKIYQKDSVSTDRQAKKIIEEKIIEIVKGRFEKSISRNWNTKPFSKKELERIGKESEELNKVYQLRSDENFWQDGFVNPIEKTTESGKITSPFGQIRINPKNKWARFHRGIDFQAPMGFPIQAIGKGKVVHLGREYFLEGNITIIDHGSGIFSAYLHQSEFLVNVGDLVEKNQVIGKVGSTGNSNKPHLHLAIKINEALINPVKIIELFK